MLFIHVLRSRIMRLTKNKNQRVHLSVLPSRGFLGHKLTDKLSNFSASLGLTATVSLWGLSLVNSKSASCAAPSEWIPLNPKQFNLHASPPPDRDGQHQC
jgi:hypothetical protein